MKFVKGRELNGFRVLRAEENAELEARAVRMEHIRTGAQLFWLDNGAENKVFSITFRTLPEDGTGVFHILEHSVLCGSREYPVKEPFVELLKSSMSTFLNAMTFPDMTMYPVSSRNPRDLMNLTKVYLDAVFEPAVMHDRKRFCQEGWHIGRDEDGKPVYRGVVFNEMKGAMSDLDNLIDHRLTEMLFPDSSYGFNSGGDPEAIPTLSYEKFKEQYRRHYHPSNARIYLDGAVPMDEMLPLLDSYFSRYSRTEAIPAFRTQKPTGSEETLYYELGQEEKEENRGCLTLGRITGTWQDRTENMARAIICDVLTGSNEAPLKRAALERGLAQDLSLSADDTGLQSYYVIHAENVTDGKEQDILDLLKETGEKIAREGLNRDAAEASLNRMIFNLREEEEPRGIGRCIRSMSAWLYGGDPEKALESKEMIRELRKMLGNGRFDSMAADMLMNHENMAVLHSLPSKTIGAEKREKEAQRIREITGGWTPQEKEENDRLIEEIETWQQSSDRAEDLATLPTLTREDADITPEWIGTEEETIDKTVVWIHRIPCNGVVHLRAYFALTDRSLEELTKTALLCGMLGKLPTAEHDALKLQEEIKRHTGSLNFAVISGAASGHEDTCRPYLAASVSALAENAEKAQELMAEILTGTRLDGQEGRIREIMMQNELGARQRIVSAGHMIAVKNAMSHYSADNAVKNALDGDRAVRYIHAFAMDPEKEMPGFLETARSVLDRTVCRKRVTVSVTASESIRPEKLISALPEGTAAPDKVRYEYRKEGAAGYRIPAQIGFAARAYRLSRCGKEFKGSMWLAGSILTLSYLWNKIRVQGGAYGAGMQMDRYGNMFSYSFRDPTPGKTLQADEGSGAFLRAFVKDGENLDKFIISALNELNPLLSPRDKGALADARMLSGYRQEDFEKIRKEVLNTSPQDLLDCADCLDQFARHGSTCVVAHEDALKACEGLEIKDL